MHQLEPVDFAQAEKAMVRERPPVRAVLEDVAVHAVVADHRQQRRPLIDGHAGVVGLDDAHAADPSPVELDHFRNAGDPVADQPREDSPFALRPLAEIAFAGVEEALGVALSLARRHRLAENLDMLARHHLQASAAEYAIDLFGCHCITVSAAVNAAIRPAIARAPSASRARIAGRRSRCTTSTVASSVLPRARANASSLQQRRASGAEPRSTRARSPGSTCLCTPSLQIASISPRRSVICATFGARTAPLPTMRAGSSDDPPGGGASRSSR